jgi:hypothetical protein
MRRRLGLLALVVLLALVAPSQAAAQSVVSIYLGGFSPRGLDARNDTDVLVSNLFNGEDSLDFEVNDFGGATVGLEWLTALGPHLEAGVGLGYYRRTVPSVYAFLVADDRTEIEQDLRLRIVPFSATVRLLPFGRYAAIQPYVGGGIGVLNWRYTEVGEFVDSLDGSIFADRFVGSGTAAGPVLIGGARFPAGAWTIGGEVRYQSARDEVPIDEFLGTTIDLGGYNYLLTFSVGF